MTRHDNAPPPADWYVPPRCAAHCGSRVELAGQSLCDTCAHPKDGWVYEPRCFHGATIAARQCEMCWPTPSVPDNIILGDE